MQTPHPTRKSWGGASLSRHKSSLRHPAGAPLCLSQHWGGASPRRFQLPQRCCTTRIQPNPPPWALHRPPWTASTGLKKLFLVWRRSQRPASMASRSASMADRAPGSPPILLASRSLSYLPATIECPDRPSSSARSTSLLRCPPPGEAPTDRRASRGKGLPVATAAAATALVTTALKAAGRHRVSPDSSRTRGVAQVRQLRAIAPQLQAVPSGFGRIRAAHPKYEPRGRAQTRGD